jgi:hypothetical protein
MRAYGTAVGQSAVRQTGVEQDQGARRARDPGGCNPNLLIRLWTEKVSAVGFRRGRPALSSAPGLHPLHAIRHGYALEAPVFLPVPDKVEYPLHLATHAVVLGVVLRHEIVHIPVLQTIQERAHRPAVSRTKPLRVHVQVQPWVLVLRVHRSSPRHKCGAHDGSAVVTGE